LYIRTVTSNSSILKHRLIFTYNNHLFTCRLSIKQIILVTGVFLSLISCANLKHNYLGAAKRRDVTFSLTPTYITKLDSSRAHMDAQMDSILQAIWIKKKEDKHLNANEVNLLTSNFGSQLEYDRIFNNMLQVSKTKRKYLTPMQRYAGVRLLQSAWQYDKNYQELDVVRRTLNRGDIGNQIPRNVIQKARKFLYAPGIRKKLMIRKKGSKPDIVDSLLQQLPKATIIKEAWYSIFRKNDRINAIGYHVFSFAGNSFMGSGGSRYTNRRKQKQYATQLLSVVQPYDILLSKSPGHLSGKIIPGYFGHAAIWLGDEIHKKKGLFTIFKNKNSARYKLHQKGIAEALRSGVLVSNMQEFADGEVFIILRPKTLSTQQKQRIVQNTMKQMGKNYDFNFDIESPDMVNCTELVFLAYDFINWKVRYFMERYTLFPDDLLLTALENEDQFEIVALMKEGNMVIHPRVDEVKGLVK
jgi:hypothetical protein